MDPKFTMKVHASEGQYSHLVCCLEEENIGKLPALPALLLFTRLLLLFQEGNPL